MTLLDSRPVMMQARLREWHTREDQSWALFDSICLQNGRPIAPQESRLLGLCQTAAQHPKPGDVLNLEGRLSHDGRSFRLEAFRWNRHRQQRAPPFLALRNSVRSRLRHSLSSQEAGLAIALLLGERREISPWLQETYRRFGLVHLLAVSGMHFWLWNQLLRRLLRGPACYLRLPILLGAAILAGATAPVMRALWVVVLRDIAARFTRPIRGIHLWATAWTLELFLFPASTLGLGFILSYAATGFLIMGAAPAGCTSLRKTLQASWVAFLGSMPFLHMIQGTLEPWSIPLSPILGLLLPLRLCGALLALLPEVGTLMEPLLHFISLLENWAFLVLEHAPMSPWLVPQKSSLWYLLAAILGMAMVHPKLPALPHLRKALSATFLLILFFPSHPQPGLSILPVGHGLGIVLCGQSQSLSFDLGSGERAPKDIVERILFPELLQRGWPTPKRYIKSHGDRDHVNGYPILKQRISMEEINVAPGTSQSILGLQPWDVTAYGCRGAKLGVSNDGGHILDVRLDNFRAVLLGDQSGYSLHDLVSRLPAGPIDILLVPHHGLTTAGFAELILHLKPKLAWSSSGPRNFPLPVAPLLNHFDIPLETTLYGPLRWSP